MDFSDARKNMVESQIRPNGVTDAGLVKAFGAVARERFVSEKRQTTAYAGDDIAIGSDRFLLDPMVLGLMLQLAEIQPTDIVLDVGPGTGYSTAIIAHVAESVVGIEEDENFCHIAEKTLLDLDVTNAAIVCGKHADGVPSEAPFDAIIINGCIPGVPPELASQLKEGRCLVTIKGDKDHSSVMVARMCKGELSWRSEMEVSAPLIPGFGKQKPEFSF